MTNTGSHAERFQRGVGICSIVEGPRLAAHRGYPNFSRNQTHYETPPGSRIRYFVGYPASLTPQGQALSINVEAFQPAQFVFGDVNLLLPGQTKTDIGGQVARRLNALDHFAVSSEDSDIALSVHGHIELAIGIEGHAIRTVEQRGLAWIID